MPNSLMFCVLAAQTGQLEPLLNTFTAEEERQMKRMLQRVDILAKVKPTKGNTRASRKQFFEAV